MRRWWLAVAVYAGLLVGLSRLRAPLAGTPDVWKARTDLAANHQMDTLDLEGPPLRHRRARLTALAQMDGKHLLVPKRAGDSISMSDLGSAPRFQTGDSGSRIAVYRLKDEPYLASVVPQGGWVVLCLMRPGDADPKPMSTHCSRGSFRVEAIHRPVDSADAAWLALRIPACRLTDIGEYLAREEHFLLIDPRSDAHLIPQPCPVSRLADTPSRRSG